MLSLQDAPDLGQGQVSSSFKIDPFRGKRDGTVSAQWAMRPHDERFLSLDDLADFVGQRRHRSSERIANTRLLNITPGHGNGQLLIESDAHDTPLTPTHWGFGQVATLAGAPAEYLRNLPPELVADNIRWGLQNRENDQIKLYTQTSKEGPPVLRSATTTTYGRIFDDQVVQAVQRIAGNGTGDTFWKVPGTIDWGSMRHNPYVDVTLNSTTLYASDRDIFIFLVDDTRPIEAGKLPNGEPDLYFRGFYVWNSDVGAASFGLATFYLRGVCQNRNLWGTEDFREVRIRHTANAPARFAVEAAPAIHRLASSSPKSFVDTVKQARSAVVATNAEERLEFLVKRGFTKSQSNKIVEVSTREEGRPPNTIYDFVQGVTALARAIPQTEKRVALEQRARTLMMAA